MSTFGHFRLRTSLESSPVSVNFEIDVEMSIFFQIQLQNITIDTPVDPETDSDEEIEINYEEETRYVKINENLTKKLKNNSEVSSYKIFSKNKKKLIR